MNDKISIIIPVYNIEKYISATLDSVLAQTYSNIEIVVVNDGSVDQSGTILDAYAAKDDRIKVIHKENGGVTSARLRGVQDATGEWIGFVDGDDFIEPEMYERLLGNALKYQADISHCGYQMVFPNGRVDYYYNTDRVVKQDKITGLADLLSGSFIEPGLWNKLFHKTLFHSLLHDDLMPVEIRINEDLLMNYWLFKEAKSAIYEDFCPYHYVLRKGSAATSSVNKHKLWNPLRVTEIILEDVMLDVKHIAYQRLIRVLVSGASMRLKQNPDLIKPYRKYTRKLLRKKVFEVMRSNCGNKLKCMAVLTAIWPTGYRVIHSTYERITGLDKIYDLE